MKEERLVFGEIKFLKLVKFLKIEQNYQRQEYMDLPLGGIWGREKEGSCSIVISGGYEDDIDELNYIHYTCQGGQDKPGGKQVSNQ